MALNLLTVAQLTLPAAADGVTLTAPASSWGNSTYQQLTASISGAAILTGVTLRTTFNSSFHDFAGEVDIATGAAASEVVIATVRFAHNFFGTGPNGIGTIPFPIGIENIANGARVSARIRVSTTAAFTCTCSITYLSTPLTASTYLTTPNPITTIPPAANSITLTGGSPAWANGTYQQLRTNSGSALLIVGIAMRPNGASFEVDLATGSGGAESVITTIACGGDGGTAWPGWMPFPNPIDNVAASTRIAARCRSSVASSTIPVALMVIEKPLLVGSAFASFGTGV